MDGPEDKMRGVWSTVVLDNIRVLRVWGWWQWNGEA